MIPFKYAVFAGLLSLGVAVAPASHAAGTLSIAASAGDPGSWDPIDTFLVTWGGVGSQIYDGLTMRTADMKLVPGLATSWEMLDKAQVLWAVSHQCSTPKCNSYTESTKNKGQKVGLLF